MQGVTKKRGVDSALVQTVDLLSGMLKYLN